MMVVGVKVSDVVVNCLKVVYEYGDYVVMIGRDDCVVVVMKNMVKD
jgi:hypothetical protein